MTTARVRKNTPERLFEELAIRNGWKVSKKGWPDFMGYGPDGEFIAVEVKPRHKNGTLCKLLKREQAKCMDTLEAHGIKCYVSDGVTLERYKREIHAPLDRRYSRHRQPQEY